MPNLTAISIFSGGGGLDLGLEAVGFQTLFATDVDPYSAVTLQWGKAAAARQDKPLLSKAIILREDINDLSGSLVREAARVRRGEIGLLAGGPPCQAFSVFGRRRGRLDARAALVFEYLRLLSEMEPEVFVFENVFGLLTVEGGSIFAEVSKALAKPKAGLRFELSVLRLNAVNFAVPQFRDRIFIVGSRNGKKIEELSPLTADPQQLSLQRLPTWRTVGDALRDLPRAGSAYPRNHTGREHSQRIISRYRGMAPGARDRHTRINKLDPRRPSYTIIVGSDKGGGKGHIHPWEAREVTPRESARIQTFPDWWAFAGSVRHPIRQVGNAVPPLLASAVGNAIREQVLGVSAIRFKDIVARLDQQHLFRENGSQARTEADTK